ncbi:MAG: hypothetical protein OJF49_003687 [Ktedonobacterales bacterium]|jgi:Gpi18-like mannosyltransferase|nr:MAG: hypothetical protein OJF49_003687 [Ktedonobacterales bacterium]
MGGDNRIVVGVRGARERLWRGWRMPPTHGRLLDAPTGGAPPLMWRAIAKEAAVYWLASRALLLVFTWVAFLVGVPAAQGQPTSDPALLLHAWLHWDGYWYEGIARLGYWNGQSTAFFPLYPLLIGAGTLLIGEQNRWFAALLVANLGTLAAFIGMALLAANEYGARTAVGTLRALVVYPAAFFLAAPYTEGIFLGCAAFGLLFARRGAWGWAALCVLLACLTRITGVILILPLVWEFVRQQRQTGLPADRRGRWRALATLAMVACAGPLGIGVYMLYLWGRFGNPTIFLSVEQVYWGHNTTPLWDSLALAAARYGAIPPWTMSHALMLIEVSALLIFAVFTLVTMRRMPFAFTLYMLGLLYLCVSSPILKVPDIYQSSARYLIVGAPFFVLLGREMQCRPWLDFLVVCSGFLLQAVLLANFLAGNWVL